MRTGTVLVCDLGGLGNRIFKSGDKVNERNFPPNNWDALVKGGFIKEDEPKEEKELEERELAEGEKLTEGELPEGSPLKEGESVSYEELVGVGAEAIAVGKEHEAQLGEKKEQSSKRSNKRNRK